MSTTVVSALAGLIVVALLAFALVLNARRMQRLVMAVVAVAVLLTVAGFVAILIGNNRQEDYNNQQDWPTVEASVLKAEVQSAEEGKCDVHLIYSYTVDGATYTNDDLTSEQPQECSPAQDRADTYDEDTSIKVRYDPNGPQHSFIESARAAPDSTTINGGRALMALGGLGMLGIGAWFWTKRDER